MTTQSKPPPSEELDEAHKKLVEACAAIPAASEKHASAAAGLKKTISDPKFKAVRQPTPSQLEVERPPEKR